MFSNRTMLLWSSNRLWSCWLWYTWLLDDVVLGSCCGYLFFVWSFFLGVFGMCSMWMLFGGLGCFGSCGCS